MVTTKHRNTQQQQKKKQAQRLRDFVREVRQRVEGFQTLHICCDLFFFLDVTALLNKLPVGSKAEERAKESLSSECQRKQQKDAIAAAAIQTR